MLLLKFSLPNIFVFESRSGNFFCFLPVHSIKKGCRPLAVKSKLLTISKLKKSQAQKINFNFKIYLSTLTADSLLLLNAAPPCHFANSINFSTIFSLISRKPCISNVILELVPNLVVLCQRYDLCCNVGSTSTQYYRSAWTSEEKNKDSFFMN